MFVIIASQIKRKYLLFKLKLISQKSLKLSNHLKYLKSNNFGLLCFWFGVQWDFYPSNRVSFDFTLLYARIM
jgi:hypothetical protein